MNPPPVTRPDTARASTQPQREPRWSLAVLLLLLGTAGLMALRGVWEAVAVALLAAAAVAVVLHRERELLRRLVRGSDSLAALDIPLLFVDPDDSVRWASAAYVDLYEGLGRVPVGMPYAELARAVRASGAVLPARPGDADDWHLPPPLGAPGSGRSRLQFLRNGRVLQVLERRTRQGGWTSMSMDVTDLVRAREEATRAREEVTQTQALLDDALEAMPAGFEIWDQQDRLLRCNRRVLDFYPGSVDLIRPGVPFETVLRHSLSQGHILAARGRESEWAAERLAQRGRLGRPFLVEYDQRWLQIEEQRTRSGLLVAVRQDVTELVAARQGLTEARARAETQHRLLARAVDALPVAVEIYDVDDRLMLVNRLYRDWNPTVDYDALIGTSFENMVRVGAQHGMLPPEAKGDLEAWIQLRLAQRRQAREAMLSTNHDGRLMLTQETRTPEGYVVTTRQDLSHLAEKERALEAAHAQLEALVQTAAAAIVTIDARGHLRSMNLAAQALWGDPDATLIGKPSRYLLHPDAQPEAVAAFELHRDGGDAGLVGRRREFIGQQLGGRALILQAAISEVKGPDETIYVAVVTDMTEQRRVEAQLREANERLAHLSNTDSLTGLANRRRLMEHLQMLWSHGLRHGTPMAVLLVDVDHFKRFNDHHGHQAGDEALQAVAEVLQGMARRAGDLAARYGGEEFVLVLDHCDADAALQRSEELRERLAAKALPHGNAPLGRVSVSVGVCGLLPRRDLSVEEMLSRADRALYEAKAAGRDAVRLAPAAG